jgi:hypothetical protein
MIKFNIDGTMKIDREIPGAYVAERNEVEDGLVLIAENPEMEIIGIQLSFNPPSIQAQAIFTHKIGEVEKKDHISFALEAGPLAGALVDLDQLAGFIGPTPDIMTLLTAVISGAAPGIVGMLTDGVTATPV